MDRLRAVAGGVAVAIIIYGGFVVSRTLTRLFWASVRVAETVGMLLFALLVGYLAYRIFWGVSDDPRKR